MDAQTRYEKRAYFSGKRFVPLIFHLFSIEGGARHPWQLSAIATAIATWLGALSRSHGTRAHHKGGANSGEVQKTAQGERKGCTRTWKTNAPRAHRVVHRAHRAYISLLEWCMPPETPMFIKTRVDLLTPSLHHCEDYGPGSTCKAW